MDPRQWLAERFQVQRARQRPRQRRRAARAFGASFVSLLAVRR
jgi:hypothetical protein